MLCIFVQCSGVDHILHIFMYKTVANRVLYTCDILLCIALLAFYCTESFYLLCMERVYYSTGVPFEAGVDP